jgi:hypothetical protein
VNRIPAIKGLNFQERTNAFKAAKRINPLAEYAESGGEVEARHQAQTKNKTLEELLSIQPMSTQEIPLKHIKDPRLWATEPHKVVFSRMDIDPKSYVENLGFKYNGFTKEGGGLHWFTDPETGSTLAIAPEQATPEGIVKKINESRKAWKKPLIGE